ncbi:uncharacterized protein PFL1_00310 [Pseudozyma flocculosa PF-1]|uniref:Related to succinyl-coa ligase [gdp-forming] beta-chain, mitochondrial n=1 Tax=Pseudozyma flocculosa TaxID=84751 RepID=A0A5C3ERL3_9BASI|nr:uncharacterized protein PFL1_00310 [Pseudozyma flocculosa PF-1]EPQ32113.1 hypothetical protein PFL1_00310 [Pseudozyma flocculosa PF-1]SPO34953.1 related to succinyl-coa ligase [gdp-forming] beta-chain, mitochondrial precursor [Pseudozyma flocculosa]
MSLLGAPARLRPLVAAIRTVGRRWFHIQPADVSSFLAATGIKELDAVFISRGTSRPRDNDASLAVLIQADRDPRPWPHDAGAVQKASFFGPSITAAPAHALASRRDGAGGQLGQGGLGLLALRRDKPDEVRQISIPSSSTNSFDQVEADRFVASLGIDSATNQEVAKTLRGFWQLFDRHEGLWFTFKLAQTNGKVEVIDPFLEFDDFSVPRQPLLQSYHASRPLDDNTRLAEKGGLFYLPLPPTLPRVGKVGCFGYGAGNAMATMDGLNLVGGGPANFLDGGGGANRQNARLAIETLNRQAEVKSIFVNCFGGITRTDIVAQGIVDAVRENGISKPIVVRMKGTGSEDAAKTLRESGLEFAFHDDFREAAAHAVRAAEDGHL